MEAPEVEGLIDPRDNPGQASGEIEAILGAAERGTSPVIPPPPDDMVDLPGGLVKKGKVIRMATVRELVGTHEEALAKAWESAAKRGTMAFFMQVLLECGTARIGDEPEKRTPDLLKDLLMGDRDQLLLGIRQCTYGDEIEIEQWPCPSCGDRTDISLSLSEDVKVIKLDDPVNEATFTVDLRKGRKATVRLPTGHDQLAVFEQDSLTNKQRDSILLSRCIVSLHETDGSAMHVAGLGGTVALGMSIPDRQVILGELIKRQPGPRYNDVRLTHQSCGEEVSLSLGLGDLFPGV